MQVSEGRYRKFYSISKWIKKLNDSCKMFIYGIYRLDHMSLRIKLFWFLTSVYGHSKIQYQVHFLKRRGNGADLNTENRLTKSLETHSRERCWNKWKKEKGFSIITEYSKKPHSMEDKDSFSFIYGVDRICSGNLFHVREKV